MDVNKENIEEYLLLLLDGELDETATAIVIEFVESHAEYGLLMNEYLHAKIEPEPILFENKEMLLKQEPVIVPLKKKRTYIAYAAAITAIIGMSVVFKMLPQQKDTQEPSMALNKSRQASIDTSSNQPLVIKESEQKESHKQIAKPSLVKKNDTVQENIAVAVIVPRSKINALNALPVPDFKKVDVVPNDKKIVSEIGVGNITSIPPESIVLDEKDDTDSEKAAFFNNLLAQVETMKNNVQEKAKSLHISAFSIQLGNKEFTIGK